MTPPPRRTGSPSIRLGAPAPPPAWGTTTSTARHDVRDAWWYTTFPGLALTLTVFAFNVLGDRLQDALDPRSAQRWASFLSLCLKTHHREPAPSGCAQNLRRVDGRRIASRA